MARRVAATSAAPRAGSSACNRARSATSADVMAARSTSVMRLAMSTEVATLRTAHESAPRARRHPWRYRSLRLVRTARSARWREGSRSCRTSPRTGDASHVGRVCLIANPLMIVRRHDGVTGSNNGFLAVGLDARRRPPSARSALNHFGIGDRRSVPRMRAAEAIARHMIRKRNAVGGDLAVEGTSMRRDRTLQAILREDRNAQPLPVSHHMIVVRWWRACCAWRIRKSSQNGGQSGRGGAVPRATGPALSGRYRYHDSLRCSIGSQRLRCELVGQNNGPMRVCTENLIRCAESQARQYW